MSSSSSRRSSRVLYGKASSREDCRNSQYLAEFDLDPTASSSSSYHDDGDGDGLSPLERGMDRSSRGVTEDIIVFDEHNYMNTQDIVEDESNETLEIVQDKNSGVRRHAVRRCLYALVAAVLIAVIVTVSVVVPRKKQQSKSAPETAATSASSPPPLPPMLKTMCEQGYADREQNAQNYLTCNKLCGLSDCCRLPANAPGSCLTDQSNKVLCMNYQLACAVLHPNRDSDSDLNKNGEIDDREGDPTAWEDYAGTVDDGDDDDVLFDDVATDPTTPVTNIPEPPKNLATLCSLDRLSHNTGVRVCADKCQPAACCWGRNGNGVETGVSCAASAAPMCEQYAPCINLLTHNNVNADIQANIESVCSLANFEAYSSISPNSARQKCKEACQLGQCCFAKSSTPTQSTCFGKPDGFCDQYQACVILTTTTDDDSAADDWADDNADGDDDDDYYYDDAYYDDNGDDAAGDDGSGKEGAQETDNELPPPPPDIDTLCDPDFVHNDDDAFNQCAAACNVAMCCNIPALVPGSCLGYNEESCSQYQFFCGVLDQNYEGATDLSSKTDLPAGDQSSLADVCSPDALSLEWGIERCTELCAPAACCFETVDADPSSTSTDWTHCSSNPNCATYSACLNLQAMKSDNALIADNVDAACAELDTSQGWSTCQSACLQHKCCFASDSGDCSGAIDSSACDKYSACKAIFTTVTNSPSDMELPSPETVDVAGACDEALIDAGQDDECKAVCAAAKCCSIPEGVPGSCLQNSYDDCMVYHKECSVLDVGTNHTTSDFVVPSASQDLDAFCSVASLATEYGRGKCQEMCDPVKCCWSTELENGELSCRDNQNCPGYSPCLVYASSKTVNTRISNQVDSLCSDSSSTASFASECRAACIQHRCCWDGSSSDNCFASDVCEQYTRCEFLLTYHGP